MDIKIEKDSSAPDGIKHENNAQYLYGILLLVHQYTFIYKKVHNFFFK